MLLYYLFLSNSDPRNLFPLSLFFSHIYYQQSQTVFSFPWKLEITGLDSIIISLVDE